MYCKRAGAAPPKGSSQSSSRAAGIPAGGDPWLSLQLRDVRAEAIKLDIAIRGVLTDIDGVLTFHFEKSPTWGLSLTAWGPVREHVRFLHKEHSRLSTLRQMKESQIDALINSLIQSAHNKVNL